MFAAVYNPKGLSIVKACRNMNKLGGLGDGLGGLGNFAKDLAGEPSKEKPKRERPEKPPAEAGDASHHDEKKTPRRNSARMDSSGGGKEKKEKGDTGEPKKERRERDKDRDKDKNSSLGMAEEKTTPRSRKDRGDTDSPAPGADRGRRHSIKAEKEPDAATPGADKGRRQKGDKDPDKGSKLGVSKPEPADKGGKNHKGEIADKQEKPGKKGREPAAQDAKNHNFSAPPSTNPAAPMLSDKKPFIDDDGDGINDLEQGYDTSLKRRPTMKHIFYQTDFLAPFGILVPLLVVLLIFSIICFPLGIWGLAGFFVHKGTECARPWAAYFLANGASFLLVSVLVLVAPVLALITEGSREGVNMFNAMDKDDPGWSQHKWIAFLNASGIMDCFCCAPQATHCMAMPVYWLLGWGVFMLPTLSIIGYVWVGEENGCWDDAKDMMNAVAVYMAVKDVLYIPFVTISICGLGIWSAIWVSVVVSGLSLGEIKLWFGSKWQEMRDRRKHAVGSGLDTRI